MGISTTRIETETVPGDAIVHERSVRPCVLVIFGATGDLAKRKLIPALYNIGKEGLLPQAFEIVGVGRSAPDEAAFRAMHLESTTKMSRGTKLPAREMATSMRRAKPLKQAIPAAFWARHSAATSRSDAIRPSASASPPSEIEAVISS